MTFTSSTLSAFLQLLYVQLTVSVRYVSEQKAFKPHLSSRGIAPESFTNVIASNSHAKVLKMQFAGK